MSGIIIFSIRRWFKLLHRDFCRTQVRSLPFALSLSHSLTPHFEFCLNCLIDWLVCQAWISLCCYMDLSKLKQVFTWICQNCYMDSLKLLLGFVKVVTWICQSCSMYFLPFAKQNQAEVWPRFQSLLKLLLWTKGVKWIKVLNALGLLCLW